MKFLSYWAQTKLYITHKYICNDFFLFSKWSVVTGSVWKFGLSGPTDRRLDGRWINWRIEGMIIESRDPCTKRQFLSHYHLLHYMHILLCKNVSTKFYIFLNRDMYLVYCPVPVVSRSPGNVHRAQMFSLEKSLWETGPRRTRGFVTVEYLIQLDTQCKAMCHLGPSYNLLFIADCAFVTVNMT